MSVTISEPFLLSSYGLSKNLPKRVGELKRHSSYVYSTYDKGTKHSEGFATITAHGDGVHVLDVSALHPFLSHTLGPSTTFSCPAVSRTTLDFGTVTYAAIESSSELDPTEAGRTIWMWRQNAAAKMDGDSQKKHSAVISHIVSKIYLPDDLLSRVVFLSPACDLSVTDANLTIKSMLPSKNHRQALLKSFMFSCSSFPFIPRCTQQTLKSAILLVYAVDDGIHAEVVAIGEDDVFVRLGDCKLPLDGDNTSGTVSGITCSESGYLSILTRSGSWNSYQLESADDTINIIPILEPIHLTSLSALASGTHAGPSAKSLNEISLLSLGSTFVLLAGLTRSPAREIVFLIWDLQYSVLLASHSIPIPSTSAQADKGGLALELVAGSTNLAMLILTSTTHPIKRTAPDASSSLRSTVLVVPFTVPAASTIAGAMGRASHSVKWLVQNETSPSLELDASQVALLKLMRTMIEQNRPDGASTAFFEWSSKATALGGQQSDIPLGHEFVKELLDIVLQPAKGGNIPYSSKVLQFLLERQAVSANMVESGLLHALKLRNDWQSISIALDAVLDIPEAEIIDLLQSVITHHKKSVTLTTDDAMQIDPTLSDQPALPSFLSSCISYATSPAPLRLAIKQHLADAEDLTCVLEVLSEWVAAWHAVPVRLLPAGVVKNARGVMVANPPITEMSDGPPLQMIASFLQTLLDASFLTLLQYPPAHNILRRISSDLDPELTRADDMEQLRGPLEPFARAQTKALKESVEGKKDNQVDWRRRRKAAHEQSSVGVGLYRLEELVI